MDHSIFTLRKDVTPSQLSDHLYASTIQSLALCEAIGEQLDHKEDLQEYSVYAHASNLRWALSEHLKQQLIAADGLEMMRICQGIKPANEPKQGLLKRAKGWLLGEVH